MHEVLGHVKYILEHPYRGPVTHSDFAIAWDGDAEGKVDIRK